MVSNINLVSSEVEKKTGFSGKASLIISVVLLVLAALGYTGLKILSSSYAKEKGAVETQIQSEKVKISGPEYAELADFQERLILLEQIIVDHSAYDSYLKNFSKYVMPGVRVSSLEWKNGGGEVSISGIATNFDTLSRQLILFKNAPIIQSVEFKNATESLSEGGGVGFTMTLKIDKESLK
ncbi:MAG: hypothetical protein A3J76_03445 [Candidatus Moranbacteria bacterium RBG_13_45_13]|nr:MAG: hypothetical protein A3J76_03445 [Candidatus Moranbacteria bacterium RBG_13_45_13]